jgi:hypothetical protein
MISPAAACREIPRKHAILAAFLSLVARQVAPFFHTAKFRS